MNDNVYELTLTPNYVSSWGFNEAVREFIQNGVDQESIDASNKFSLNYDKDNKTLTFRNEKSKLNINTLLLGRSSKTNNEDTVGQFGEGYKIATLVLTRLNKDVTIYNNEKNEIWKSRFKNSEKWHEKILAFYIEKHDTEKSGLDIVINNVSSNEYYDLYNVWIKLDDDYEYIDTPYGEIITDPDFQNCVYINGLKVDYNGKDFEYGYNFKPKYIQLERDRKTCDSWNAQDITSKMTTYAVINGKLNMNDVKKLFEGSKGDTYSLSYCRYGYNGRDKIKEGLLKAFDEENPDSIPVKTQKQLERVSKLGGKAIVVADQVYDMLENEYKKRVETLIKDKPEELTLKQEFYRWIDIYGYNFDETAIQNLKTLIEMIN